ncbi:MAG: sigma-70 family RNA polymerase sigma factor [Deltaproteobacteria bacterium]|nr:sigma-70 family RNA polymerase sigma factor [Deltaproteobacteria bacterium]
MDEAVLLERLRRGDEAAFSHLVERHHRPLLRLARSFVSSQAVAEEVVQDTWVAVITGLPTFEARSSLKTWIFRILANRARTRGVREGRSVPFSSLSGDDEPAVDASRFSANGMWSRPPEAWDGNAPDTILMNGEAMRSLSRAMEELPPAQAAVVTLRDVAGMDSAEVCSVLEISETNQRVLLHRARSKLRRVLEEHVGAK